MEFLKELLGEELFTQVEAKLKGNEKVQLINAKDGTYIPKAKFDQTNDENKSLKDQLKDRDKQLKDLAGTKDATDELKTKINELQDANKTAAADHDTAIKTVKMDYAIKAALKDAKDPKEVLPHLDMTKIKLNNDGTISGMTEQLDPIKKDKGYLFNQPGAPDPGVGGMNPGSTGPNTSAEQYTANYKAAVDKGNTFAAIKIKQEAFSKGIEL